MSCLVIHRMCLKNGKKCLDNLDRLTETIKEAAARRKHVNKGQLDTD